MKTHLEIIVALGLTLCGCSQTPDAGSRDESALRDPKAGFEDQHADRPPSSRTLYSMAGILATQGKDNECELVLRRCIGQYPSFTPAYNSLAELQMRQGRIHQATDVLRKALTIRRQDPVLLNNLGVCYLMQKEYERALESFTGAAGRVPESEKYRANMATALGLLGRHDEALALLQQVLPKEQAGNNAAVLQQAFEKRTAQEKLPS
jgi:Flp pilus assembly protein TadD